MAAPGLWWEEHSCEATVYTDDYPLRVLLWKPFVRRNTCVFDVFLFVFDILLFFYFGCFYCFFMCLLLFIATALFDVLIAFSTPTEEKYVASPSLDSA